uniref:NADH-ubiquinone oxidoreductase chain 1 n=1 Tax=Fissurella volcano TaxID=707972 RepID=H6V537_FISVO|nr:NADH dehydrogenase subunit 1 [Fissurella volcano]AFB78089.1 NADH dehydrogenase subunit 1 [Fissurella volcano]
MAVLSSVCCMLLTYIGVLLAVAFFTLFERKGLGYFQMRKGPNKVGLAGIGQPFADAVKLFSKESFKPSFANFVPYVMAPVFALAFSLLMWEICCGDSGQVVHTWGLLFFLCVSSLNVYTTLVAGWSSSNKYSLLGAVRAIAQSISYEVNLAMILFFMLFISHSFDFIEIKSFQEVVIFVFMLYPLFAIWLVSCLAETQRAPFDFAEGESELVSGFNVEYSSAGFALLFLAEYANILIMSLFTSVLFWGGASMGFLWLDIYDSWVLNMDVTLMFSTLCFSFFFIWVRATMPRLRYDLLMSLSWKVFLPVTLSSLCLFLGANCYVLSLTSG